MLFNVCYPVMIKKTGIFTLLFLAVFHVAGAQEGGVYKDSSQLPSPITTEEIYEEPPIDTMVTVRAITISMDSVQAWKNRTEFQYIHTLDSLLRRSQQAEKITPVKRTGGGGSLFNKILGGGFLSFILWTLAILFVLVIVYQLSRSGRIFSGSRKESTVSESPDEEELILHSNFDELISGAVKKEDYRLATRYQFLKLLQQLREKNHIAYEPDKTNSRYLREIPLALQPAFSALVLQYEFAWYGHYDIREGHYHSLEKDFRSFAQKI